MSFFLVDTTRESHHTIPLNTRLWPIWIPADGGSAGFKLHNHDALEINLVLKGEMLLTVDDRKYVARPGDAVLANPFSLHSGEWLTNDPDNCFIGFTTVLSKLLNFSHSPLIECCRSLETGKFCFDEFYPADESRVSDIIRELLDVYTDKTNANECRSLMLTFELLSLLFEKHYRPTSHKESGRKNIDFAKAVSLFVKEHYQQDIATSDAADALHMELSQFCHTFKRQFGLPFRNHLCKYRCTRAAELYKNSGMAITDIAAAVGFSDYCYFSRSFKKHIGQSPARYFGKWH